MEAPLNSKEKLDAFLADIEPTLPAGVCIRQLRPGGLSGDNCFKNVPRYLSLRSNVEAAPPNPIGIDIYLHSAYDPFVVAVELYVKVNHDDEHSAWLYSVNLVVDDLLTKDEVRYKVHQAASIIAAYRNRKFECGDLPLDAAGRALTEDDRTGEVVECVEEE